MVQLQVLSIHFNLRTTKKALLVVTFLETNARQEIVFSFKLG
jgi:hypothetical protein